jgi:hypothetical protein
MGLSVLRVKRRDFRGRLDVVEGDRHNRRVHLLSGLGVNKNRSDGYQNVFGWGATAHETGDDNYLVGTGPAATQVFNLSSDGLGNKIIGTGFNCSGGVTPWGTVFSARRISRAARRGSRPGIPTRARSTSPPRSTSASRRK